jgi:hypothetical protein
MDWEHACAYEISILLMQFLKLNMVLEIFCSKTKGVEPAHSRPKWTWKMPNAVEEGTVDDHAQEYSNNETYCFR